MREILNDSFYEILKEYDRLAVDYCLMENDSSSEGYLAHKEAITFTMNKLQKCYPWISFDIEKATAKEVSPDRLFNFPENSWKKTTHGTTVYHDNFQEDGKIPYWYAFAEPPHGTGSVNNKIEHVKKNYDKEDFVIINNALFPKGIDELEVYEWSTDWSNYFDAGHEWWGTMCYSIYDKKMNRYVVLMASETD